MRPVLLELNGFASFRQLTTIDFTDSDFFAFVGPTGAGKSTVVDAIVFALYGTAPRWGHSKAVAYALAPTVNRGTVRLVFDVGPARYVIAREIRRSPAGVSQRSISLERFLDPQAGGHLDADDDTEVVASDIKGVNAAIGDLLGLTLDDFCQCVVLPQGQFASFLKATVKDRQEILLKLLGARQYEQIRAAAADRAGAARQRLDIVAAQLAAFADASAATVEAAQSRLTDLDGLHDVLAGLTRVVDEAAAARDAAAVLVTKAESELDVLRAVVIPDGTAQWQQRLADARAAAGRAERADAVHAADSDAARAALVDAGDRRVWERLAADWAELADITVDLPTAADAAAAAERATAQAEAAVLSAVEARDQTRTAADDAAGELARLVDRLSAVEGEEAALSHVARPDGIDELGQRRVTADEQVRAAEQALQAAERADEQAAAALASGPDLAQLTTAHDLLLERREVAARHEDAVAATDAAEARLTAAADALQNAERAEADAREKVATVTARRLAADLRAGLAVGAPCPVCDQAVAALPGRADDHATELRRAQQTLSAAVDTSAQARARHAEALAEAATRTADRRSIEGRLDELTGRLGSFHLPSRDEAEAGTPGEPASAPGAVGSVPEQPTLARVVELIAVGQSLQQAAQSAEAAVRQARSVARAAAAGREELAGALAAARAGLHETTRTVLGYGAPDTGGEDVAAGWTMLADWARQRRDAVRVQLHEGRAAADGLRSQVARRSADADRARRTEADLRSAHQQAIANQAEVSATLARQQARHTALTTQLDGAPGEAEVAAGLARIAAAEVAEKAAYERLSVARAATQAARSAAAQAEASLDEARTSLRQTRDRVVQLGAPDLGGSDLHDDWRRLAHWAHAQAEIREHRLPDLRAALSAADEALAAAGDRLRGAVRDRGIDLPDEATAADARVRVAQAISDATHDRDRAVADLARREQLDDQAATATEEYDVAASLADLLKANKFQRWLAGAALETLVLGASSSLLELSGGQFELTHRNGEFFVIDNTDAESERSVRTLSGGETFQTSLALALALSEQLSFLTASGGARLDSIFLDEGFGTLDPDSLDVVASTLERLAQGDRMVGIITHVPELAERVPIRYVVRRDSTGSHVTRESVWTSP